MEKLDTLASFERAIAALEGHDLTTAAFDRSLSGSAAAEVCSDLDSLSQRIRSMLWRDRDAAYALARRADVSSRRIADENGLIGGAPLPRLGSVGRLADGRPFGGNY